MADVESGLSAFDFAEYDEDGNIIDDSTSPPDPKIEDTRYHTDDKDPKGNDDEYEQGEIDLITKMLLNKGVQDPTKIKFENDNGDIEEVSFYDLDEDEQLNILQGLDTEDQNLDIDSDLSDVEIEAINFMRENNATLNDIVEYYQNQAVEAYKANQGAVKYEIDDYSDQDIFAADLGLRFPDLSDDEIATEVERAMENETLFNKKVAALRVQFKENEKSIIAQELNEKFETDKVGLINSAKKINNIGIVELDNNDKNEVLHVLLERDINNKTLFDKAIDDPSTRFKIAWFLSKGDEFFREITKELSKVNKKGESPQISSDELRKRLNFKEVATRTVVPKSNPRNDKQTYYGNNKEIKHEELFT